MCISNAGNPPQRLAIPSGLRFFVFPPSCAGLVWLAYLQRYRMIDLDIRAAADEGGDTTRPGDGSQSRYYTGRNTLGNVISGRGYVLSWGGRGGHAAAYSPLLWVNREARHVTLGFYRVQLPFSGLRREQVLFLNPEYDVVSVQLRYTEGGRMTTSLDALTLLADLLHDAKAHDSKDQGIAHLALNWGFHSVFPSPRWATFFHSTPAAVHPIAAASFTRILQHGLRTLLFLVPFRERHRGQAVRFRERYRGQANIPSDGDQCHFAQTFPLARRDCPAGSFDWLEADPRPGVEVDIRNLTLGDDPRSLAQNWKQLEQAFGIARPTDRPQQQQHQQQAETNRTVAAGLRLYVCPSMIWPYCEREEVRRQISRYPPLHLSQPGFPVAQLLEGKDEEEEQPRSELKRHLREEDEYWQYSRSCFHDAVRVASPNAGIVPTQGSLMDAETFERMERLSCTAIGMWLFPAEAFGKPTDVRQIAFDMSAVKPGLFLFDV